MFRSNWSQAPTNPVVVRENIQRDVPHAWVLPLNSLVFSEAKILYTFSEPQIASLISHNVPNPRNIEMITMAILRPNQAGRITLQHLAQTCRSAMNRVDNCALYAKVLFFALLRESFDRHKIVSHCIGR